MPDSDSLWLSINDPEISSDELVTLVAERTEDRRAQIGYESPRPFPTFGHVVTLPAPAESDSPALFYHLQALNDAPLPDTTPVLAESPALRVPILGRLWRMIRGELHNAILFYVNRSIAHDTAVNNHIVSVLNELTRVNQSQQREIAQLREELAQLKTKNDLPYD